jgi:hypothetical protein
MADLSKLKKRSRLGEPPAITAAGDNLSAPETAPAAETTTVMAYEPKDKLPRPARKTGRTEAFGTRVSAEFLNDFKRIAFEDNLKFVELLERSLEAYKAQR